MAMFDSLRPASEPKRLWLALLVIGAIGAAGLLLMISMMSVKY
jgi:hypothetical protein